MNESTTLVGSHRLWRKLLALVVLLWAGSAAAQHNHERGRWSALLFPHAIFGTNGGDLYPASPDRMESAGRELASSVFLSYDSGGFQFLTELLISNFEKDIERLQVGYKLGPRDTLWFGRFHNPAGIWNIEHHHGAYLQTSISRPYIVGYEDGGGGLPASNGVLPMHITGLLWEGSRPIGAGAINYEIGFGRGPALDEALVPFGFLQPSVPGGATFTLRVGFNPDETSGTQAGVFTTQSEIPVIAGGDLRLSLAGFYAQWTFPSGRLFGEWFEVSNRNNLAGTPRDDKLNAWFLQGEYRVRESVTAYARVERSQSVRDDPYLALFPHFSRAGDIVGLRWDFTANQAVTAEYSASVRRDGTQFNQLRFQWSAVFK